MKKLLILIFLLTMGIGASNAQQTLRFSNYLFNGLIINPATAGSNDYLEIMASYRKQWAGFEGAPSTNFLSADKSIFYKRIGLGLQVVGDKVGAISQNGVVASAAYRLRVAELSWISMGFSLGMFNNRLDGTELIRKDVNDVALPTDAEGVNIMDLKAGLYYKAQRFTAGLAAANILKPAVNYTGVDRNITGDLNRYYYLTSSYRFSIDKAFDITPSLLVKSNEAFENQFDFSGIVTYKKYISAGMSYRNKESVNFILDYLPNANIRLGYAFDITTSKIANYQNGTHEIMIAYRIIPSKKLMENPRYFYNK